MSGLEVVVGGVLVFAWGYAVGRLTGSKGDPFDIDNPRSDFYERGSSVYYD